MRLNCLLFTTLAPFWILLYKEDLTGTYWWLSGCIQLPGMTPPTKNAATKTRHTHTPFAKNDPHYFSPFFAPSLDAWGPAQETMWYGWENKTLLVFFSVMYPCKLAGTWEKCNSRGFWGFCIQTWLCICRIKKEHHLKSFLKSPYPINLLLSYFVIAESLLNTCKLFQTLQKTYKQGY